ncbi:MAG: molybdopterin-dependent oxidoreductase, partial [Proteobacteria bacterium]|nr:molybdopterin-dependent oxidoreductase [Pseudomonadota bacterium]
MPMTKHNTPHDSAHKHVTGQAVYIDDIPLPSGTLHAYLGLSTCAHGRILTSDFTKVLAAKNVIGVLSAKDIIGINDVSPLGLNDDPIFADTHVEFYGQPIFVVIATDRNSARAAARLAKITYEPLPPAIDITQAITQNTDYVVKPMKLERGDIAKGFASSAHCIKGQLTIGGQDHFYLEGQIALAEPCEDGGMRVYSSTQHPSEVQHMVAGVLGIAQNAVVVRVRRMGGGFGGKETQGN